MKSESGFSFAIASQPFQREFKAAADTLKTVTPYFLVTKPLQLIPMTLVRRSKIMLVNWKRVTSQVEARNKYSQPSSPPSRGARRMDQFHLTL